MKDLSTLIQRRKDQRELMTVIQRNFRKYMQLRNWGWFIIIHKTKPLIGQSNPEEELRVLEEKANESYGAYQKQLDTKVGTHMMVLDCLICKNTSISYSSHK